MLQFAYTIRKFKSRCKPRMFFLLHLGFVRLVLWGPYPFLTLAVGNLLKADSQPTGKVPAFQIYLGLKCPGGGPSQDDFYYYEYTIKELAAIRFHTAALQPLANDQAGA